MKTTRLYLIRHGQVVNHHELRYNGHFDVDITDIGVLQMENISSFLTTKSITAVYSSDLQRAFKGAEIIGKYLEIKPVKVVAHGGVNRVILCDAMKLPMENFFRIEQDYGCLNVIDYFDDGVKVVKLLNGGVNQELRVAEVY